MQDRSPPTRRNSLATHGRTIHLGHLRRGDGDSMSAIAPIATELLREATDERRQNRTFMPIV